MRCFVTGATGLIGSHLVRLLLENDCQVGVLMRPTSDPWRIQDVLHHLHVITGDLTVIEQAGQAIQKFAPDVILHLGWYGVSNRYRNDPAQVSQNLYWSLKLLQLAREAGCQCWVGLGSQAEYGSHDGVLTEDLPTRPVTIYGVVKLCVGLLSQKLCKVYGIRFLWLRLLAAYGPTDDPEHMIPYVILSLLRGQKPALTLGEQRWDYLYVEDAARAIWQVVTHPTAQGIFNLGSGEAHTVRNIVECIRDLIDPGLPLGLGEVPYRPDQTMHLQADISKLKQVTGWSPHIDLDEGLRRTAKWFQTNMGGATDGGYGR